MDDGQPRPRLLLGGRIYPDVRRRPVGAALIRNGRISWVGDEAEIPARVRRTAEVVWLDGATVTAGFTDAHVHLTTWALSRRRVSLSLAGSPEEAARRVAEEATPEAGVVRGHGWNASRWARWPTRADLDDRIAGPPVFLDSQDLHSAWLNSAALRLCGISRETVDPLNGAILRDPVTGEPTGVLLEAAREMALRRLPEPGTSEVREALVEAQAALHGLGLTGVHSVEATGLRDFQLLAEAAQLRLRVLHHIQLDHLDGAIAAGLRSGFGNDWIRVGGVKMFLDGSLGSRTAWLREPYVGTASTGVQVLAELDFRSAVESAADNGLASTVHAIGDAAVALAIEVLERIPPPSALPHRIEHLQLCPPDLWGRAGRSGIIGSVQPVHLLTDVPAAERHWGHERSRGAYPFGAVADAGMVLAFGSDAPVESPDPRPGLFAAVTRSSWSAYEGGDEDDRGWFPEHRLTAARAVAGYTEGPAAAAGWSARRGRLLPGYDADLAAWSIDPVTADAGALRSMRCRLTMIGGEVVHRD